VITTGLSKSHLKLQKTSKASAVVAVMSFFCKKRCNLRSTYPGNEKLSRQKGKSTDFPEEKFPRTKKLFSKNKKMPVAEEIST
jgi:hypothetical protein